MTNSTYHLEILEASRDALTASARRAAGRCCSRAAAVAVAVIG